MCEHLHLYTSRHYSKLSSTKMVTYKTICLDCLVQVDEGYEQIPITIGKEKK